MGSVGSNRPSTTPNWVGVTADAKASHTAPGLLTRARGHALNCMIRSNQPKALTPIEVTCSSADKRISFREGEA